MKTYALVTLVVPDGTTPEQIERALLGVVASPDSVNEYTIVHVAAHLKKIEDPVGAAQKLLKQAGL